MANEPILVGSGSITDQIMAGLISQGFTTGSVSDRERARLLARLLLVEPQKLSMMDLYTLANENNRLWEIIQVFHAALPGGVGDYISTPDTAVLDIVGDIDLRAKVALNDWTPAVASWILSKFDAAGADRAYALNVQTGGQIQIVWSADGTALLFATSNVGVPFSDGQIRWVRATLDVNNGAGNAVATFYTSIDGVTWTQLGIPQLVGAITSIFVGGDNLQIGARSEGASNFLIGKFYAAEIRSGIDGAIVTRPVASVSGIIDGIGSLVYTLRGNAAIVL